MAVLWKKEVESDFYKVTQAGNAVRLYRNGVLHSQWNHKKPVSGKLWDLFLLSSFSNNTKISDVLVLGAGGGAIINLVHYFFPKAKIDAVDLDVTHLYVAKNYFKVCNKHCNLIRDDAQTWLRKNKNNKYDLVIDDVFFESGNVPYRSINAKEAWLEELLDIVKEKGTLVVNYADNKEWRESKKKFRNITNYYVAMATHYKCANKIIHISKQAINSEKIKSNLSAVSKDYLYYWSNKIISYKNL